MTFHIELDKCYSFIWRCYLLIISKNLLTVSFQETFCIWLTVLDAASITFISYLIMIALYIKIIKHFKAKQHLFSAASRRVQMDLNRILLAEAVIPILSAFLPMTIHVLSGFTNFNFVFESFICGILYSWIPAGNAISVLCFVTAYRKKMKQLLTYARRRIPRVMAVSVTATTA